VSFSPACKQLEFARRDHLLPSKTKSEPCLKRKQIQSFKPCKELYEATLYLLPPFFLCYPRDIYRFPSPSSINNQTRAFGAYFVPAQRPQAAG
jgi:hypothetical protein